jgi:hypothetical protein
MAANITDYGGATLDLQDGVYLISTPLSIPPGAGNLQIVRGTLRASPQFPNERYLVEVGAVGPWQGRCRPTLPDSSVPDAQASCNQFINLSEIFLDAAHVAAGGVRVASAMGTTIGPSAFFTGFRDAGVRIDGGHEVMLTEAWLSECYWTQSRGGPAPPGGRTPPDGPCQEDPDKPGGRSSRSVGVMINGSDHYLTDVIVFEFTRTGVEVNGTMNLLQGVHAWNAAVWVGEGGESEKLGSAFEAGWSNPDLVSPWRALDGRQTKSTESSRALADLGDGPGGYVARGGVGIAVRAPQNRLLGCYFDFSRLEAVDPVDLIVTQSMFLNTRAVLVSRASDQLVGVRFNGNVHAATGPSVELSGGFSGGVACDVSGGATGRPGSTMASAQLKATRARGSAAAEAPVTRFEVDLGSTLLLPKIDQVVYSLVQPEGEPFVRHRAIVNGTNVVVETDAPTRGRVDVEAFQAM